jgi:hypothetical protein
MAEQDRDNWIEGIKEKFKSLVNLNAFVEFV